MGAVITLILCMSILFAQLIAVGRENWIWFPVAVIGTLVVLMPKMLRISHEVALARAHKSAEADPAAGWPMWKKALAVAGPVLAGGGLSLVISLAAFAFNAPDLEADVEREQLQAEIERLREKMILEGVDPGWP